MSEETELGASIEDLVKQAKENREKSELEKEMEKERSKQKRKLKEMKNNEE